MSAKDAVIAAIHALPDGLSEPEIVAELTARFDTDEDWEEAWLPEWERRLADARAGTTVGVPHEEVMRQLREKYG